MQSLPIDAHIPALLKGISENPNCILKASPGSGKTTRLPPALLKAPFLGEGEILVLEPRRLAAKFASTYVAKELHSPIGELVGYQFRFENRTSRKTKLTFLTEGTLLRRLESDPTLKNTKIVILDEFHERHLQTDVALSYLKHLQATKRPDLKIVVMSATLKTEPLEKFLENAVVFDVEAPRFPVELRYLSSPTEKSLEDLVVKTLLELYRNQRTETALVFLPGIREIRRVEEKLLAERKNLGVPVYILHGSLPQNEQDAALSPDNGARIILSTNIAESSLTIDGVSLVVDSGLERQASFSHWSYISQLTTKPISRASAIQRAGRAGRQRAGICVRLYTEHEYLTKPEETKPEIHRVDLLETFLDLTDLGIVVDQFSWYEAPEVERVRSTTGVLRRLNALSDKNALTSDGKRMLDFPISPRFAAVLVEAEKRGVAQALLPMLVKLMEGEGTVGIDTSPRQLITFNEKRLYESLAKIAKSDSNRDPDAISLSLLHGFPERVCKKRSKEEYLLATGEVAFLLEKGHSTPPDLALALEVDESKPFPNRPSRLYVKSLVSIEETWLLDLPHGLLEEVESISWDKSHERAHIKKGLYYGKILLEEKSDVVGDAFTTAKVFFEQELKLDPVEKDWARWINAFSRFKDKEHMESAIARALLVLEQSGLAPQISPENTYQVLAEETLGNFKKKFLEELDWDRFFARVLGGENAGTIERRAPLYFTLTPKRRAKIKYALNQKPSIESRLQDFVGIQGTPSIMDGKLPLVLHLLAPNGRAVQVTQDLPGFWQNHYPKIRTELSRRYPRHQWP